jgi:hypothetical protein
VDSTGDLAGGARFAMKKLLNALGHRDRNRDRYRYRFLTANYHRCRSQESIAIPIPKRLADFTIALPGC